MTEATGGGGGGLDINKASPQELEKAPMIGQERARKLVEARPIRSWEDLKKVEGFDEKLVENLRSAGATLGEAGRA